MQASSGLTAYRAQKRSDITQRNVNTFANAYSQEYQINDDRNHRATS